MDAEGRFKAVAPACDITLSNRPCYAQITRVLVGDHNGLFRVSVEILNDISKRLRLKGELSMLPLDRARCIGDRLRQFDAMTTHSRALAGAARFG